MIALYFDAAAAALSETEVYGRALLVANLLDLGGVSRSATRTASPLSEFHTVYP